MAETVRYFVLTATGETEERPGGLARLRLSPEGHYGEVLHGGGAWVDTPSVLDVLFGQRTDMVEVDEARANELIAAAPWPGMRKGLKK